MTEFNKLLKKVEEKLFNDLDYITKDYHLLNTNLFLPLERFTTSHDRTTPIEFYPEKPRKGLNPNQVNFTKSVLDKVLNTAVDQDYVVNVVETYVRSPFGVFAGVLSLPASDIFIVAGKITINKDNLTNSIDIVIPDKYLNTYNRLVDLFLSLTMNTAVLKNTQFNPSHATQDYTSGGVRINAVHPALNAVHSDRPIISLRKQVIATELKELDKDYINSLGLSKTQLQFIQDIAVNGSYCIFGETGAGKTVLLRYMGGYQLENKRNLITIEDTPELFLPVNITYLANKDNNISALFQLSLRENPSHVLIGETRSAEIVDILQQGLVFKVGTTFHADSLAKLVMRIVFLVKKVYASYSTSDIQDLITAVMDGFIYVKNRKVESIWKRKEDYKLDGSTLDKYEVVK